MWFWIGNILFFIEGGSIVSFLLLGLAVIFLGSSEILFHIISFILLILKYLIPIISLICGFGCLSEESQFSKIWGFIYSVVVAIITYKFFAEYNPCITLAFQVSRFEYVVKIIIGFFMWFVMSLCGFGAIEELMDLNGCSHSTKVKALFKSSMYLAITVGIYFLLLYLNGKL